MKKYDLAADFSDEPFGRHPADGKFSGEKFRETLLHRWIKEALEHGEQVEIDLDNVPLGIGSSFLEESFGGLVRKGLLDKNDILKVLRIKSEDDPSYITEIMEYIQEAKPKPRTATHE